MYVCVRERERAETEIGGTEMREKEERKKEILK